VSLQTPESTDVRHSTIFDRTTSLQSDPLAPGHFTVDLDEAWSSLVGIHGGYLTAIAIKAAQQVVAGRPVRTVTTTFLRPGAVGPATVEVEVVRRGRSITNLVVTLWQSSRVVLTSQIVAAEVWESTSWDTTGRIAMPDFERCTPIAPPPGVGHFDHAVAVLDPEHLPFSHGPRARVAGYVRPIEPRVIDAAWLGMVLDWFPPAAFTRLDPPAGGISVTYSIHVHHTLERLDDAAWLGGRFDVDISADGIALEKGLISDPSGRILAESFHTRWTAGPDQLSR